MRAAWKQEQAKSPWGIFHLSGEIAPTIDVAAVRREAAEDRSKARQLHEESARLMEDVNRFLAGHPTSMVTYYSSAEGVFEPCLELYYSQAHHDQTRDPPICYVGLR